MSTNLFVVRVVPEFSTIVEKPEVTWVSGRCYIRDSVLKERQWISD